MYTDATLPFPRGSTYQDGGLLTLTASPTDAVKDHSHGAGIVGRLFETTDSAGRPLVLRVVRANLDLANVRGKTVSYLAGKIGIEVDAYCDSNGEICSIMDDAYTATFDISAHDLFYVVEQGHVLALAESGVNAAGIYVMGYAASDDVTVLTASLYCIGVADEALSATVSGYASIYVGGGLKPSDPAS